MSEKVLDIGFYYFFYYYHYYYYINETLNPIYNWNRMKPKIIFLENKLKMIPRKLTTPYLVINLWNLLIRPNFFFKLF